MGGKKMDNISFVNISAQKNHISKSYFMAFAQFFSLTAIVPRDAFAVIASISIFANTVSRTVADLRTRRREASVFKDICALCFAQIAAYIEFFIVWTSGFF
jgi:CHASE2 domain-containing sensor protein